MQFRLNMQFERATELHLPTCTSQFAVPLFYAHVALSCGDDHLRGRFVQVEPPDAFSSMTIRGLWSCRIFVEIARQVQYLVGFPGIK